MLKNNLILVALALTSIHSFAGREQIASDRRCTTWGDSLDAAQAKVRVDFAVKCEKNAALISDIKHNYGDGVTSGGATVPGYPTYGRFDVAKDQWANPEQWFAPPQKKKGAGANDPAPGAETGCDYIPPGYEIYVFCASGCYTPEQGILFGSGYEPIEKAEAQEYKTLRVVSSDSTLEAPKLKEAGIGKFITDIVPGNQEILNINMVSGGQLRVTLNHPLIDGEGYVRQAQTFKVGDSLVKADGTRDPILSIKPQTIFGRVYNVSVDTTNPQEQIIVAQGYLNGSLYYQNEGVRDLNRKLLRSRTATHLLAQQL